MTRVKKSERDDILTDISRVSNEMALTIPLLEAQRAGIELYGATKFSLLSIIRPNENTLSKIIVELFNPAGSHGQGALFLNSLVSAVGLKRVGSREVIKTRLEVLTPKRRRIDIVLETQDYVIGIENKPWAAQQRDQLKDYLEALRLSAGAKQPVLVFLSNQEEETAKGEVIKLPYYSYDGSPSLYGILDSTLTDIKAAKPREFVEEFLAYIDQNFGEGYEMDATDAPFVNAVIAEYDKNPKAVASFLLAQSQLRERIIDGIEAYIVQQVKAAVPGIEVAAEGSLAHHLRWRHYPWGLRKPVWPVNCAITLESQDDSFTSISYGVRCPGDVGKIPPEDQSPARKYLNLDVVHGGRKSIWWPWYASPWVDTWDQDAVARMILQSPTGKVSDHPHVQELASKLAELAVTVNEQLSKL